MEALEELSREVLENKVNRRKTVGKNIPEL